MQNYTGYGWEGEKYGQIRDIKDIAKEIRTRLKDLKDCKFSVTIDRYTGGQALHISLMAAPFEAFGKLPEDYCCLVRNRERGYLEESTHACKERGNTQLNPYSFTDTEKESRINNGAVLTREAWLVMRRAKEIAQEYNYSDSDAMIDYFNVNFYLCLNIGKWDKSFTIAA